MQIVEHAFAPHDLVAGHPALDFVNTVTARDTSSPFDWLDGYARMLDWVELSGIFTTANLKHLRKLATAMPKRAAKILTRARELREVLHRVCSTLIAGDKILASDLKKLEEFWRGALSRAELEGFRDHVDTTLDIERSGLHFVVDTLTLRAMDLLRDFPTARARVCLGAQCGWLFIDTSKGGKRVWCDMSTCGNVIKSRRHRERHQKRG